MFQTEINQQPKTNKMATTGGQIKVTFDVVLIVFMVNNGNAIKISDVGELKLTRAVQEKHKINF